MGEFGVRLTQLQAPQQPYESLVRYQLDKARRCPEGAVVLLGDSSLGNGVDATLLSQLLGRPVVNLALTGHDSFLGTYYLAREALPNNPSLLVCIVTPETFRLPVSKRVLDLLGEGESSFSFETLAAQIFATSEMVGQSKVYHKTLFERAYGLRLLGFRQDTERHVAQLEKLDYLPQGPPRDWDKLPARQVTRFEAEPDHLLWAQKTQQLCASYGKPILWALGPSFEGAYSQPEFEAQAQAVLPDFPRLYPGLANFPAPLLGDTASHLNAEGRDQYTRQVAKAIRDLDHSKGGENGAESG